MIWIIIGIVFFILCVVISWHYVDFAHIIIWFVIFAVIVPAFIGGLFSIMLPNDIMSRNTIVENYDLMPFDNGKYIEYNNKGQMFYKTEEGYQMDDTPSNNIFSSLVGLCGYICAKFTLLFNLFAFFIFSLAFKVIKTKITYHRIFECRQ